MGTLESKLPKTLMHRINSALGLKALIIYSSSISTKLVSQFLKNHLLTSLLTSFVIFLSIPATISAQRD